MPAAYLRGPVVGATEASYVRGCTGKEAFDAVEDATRAIQRLRYSGDAYRCDTCRRWHITSFRREFRAHVRLGVK